MYSPLIDILFGEFIISKKIHLWNFYFYRTHVKIHIIILLVNIHENTDMIL